LSYYHQQLLKNICEFLVSGALPDDLGNTEPYSLQELIQHYELSLIDYVRFMAGWGMWGNVDYAERRVLELLNVIDGGQTLTAEEYDVRFRAHYCSNK